MRGRKSRSVDVDLNKDHKTRCRRIGAFSSRDSYAWRMLTELANKSICKLEAYILQATMIKKATDAGQQR